MSLINGAAMNVECCGLPAAVSTTHYMEPGGHRPSPAQSSHSATNNCSALSISSTGAGLPPDAAYADACHPLSENATRYRDAMSTGLDDGRRFTRPHTNAFDGAAPMDALAAGGRLSRTGGGRRGAPSGTPSFSDTNLFLRHLPTGLDDAHLRAAFEPFGSIVSASVMLNIHTGESLGTGFVRFENAAAAKTAFAHFKGTGRSITSDGEVVDDAPAAGSAGRKLTVQWARRQHDMALVGEKRQSVQKLFLRNVPADVSEEQLRQLLRPYGSIESVTLHADTASAAGAHASSPLLLAATSEQHSSSDAATGSNMSDCSDGRVAAPAAVDADAGPRLIAFVTYADKGCAAAACDAVHGTSPFVSCGGVPLMAKLAEDGKQRMARRGSRGAAAMTAAAADPRADRMPLPLSLSAMGTDSASGTPLVYANSSTYSSQSWMATPLPTPTYHSSAYGQPSDSYTSASSLPSPSSVRQRGGARGMPSPYVSSRGDSHSYAPSAPETATVPVSPSFSSASAAARYARAERPQPISTRSVSNGASVDNGEYGAPYHGIPAEFIASAAAPYRSPQMPEESAGYAQPQYAYGARVEVPVASKLLFDTPPSPAVSYSANGASGGCNSAFNLSINTNSSATGHTGGIDGSAVAHRSPAHQSPCKLAAMAWPDAVYAPRMAHHAPPSVTMTTATSDVAGAYVATACNLVPAPRRAMAARAACATSSASSTASSGSHAHDGAGPTAVVRYQHNPYTNLLVLPSSRNSATA